MLKCDLKIIKTYREIHGVETTKTTKFFKLQQLLLYVDVDYNQQV